MEVQAQSTPGLMAHPDVVGTAVTVASDGQAAVVIMTRGAGVAGLPSQIEGVPVVVSVTGEFRALASQAQVDTTARFPRPVPIGCFNRPSIYYSRYDWCPCDQRFSGLLP